MQIMTSNFQSSFIPKEPVTEDIFKKKKIGILGILAVSLFVISIIISAALYVYKGVTKNDIQNLQLQLGESEKNIDKKTIDEMNQFSKKLGVARSIILKHQVISNFLDYLSSSTVSSVQFTDFSYSDIGGGVLSVTLSGKALNYASIALQENIFSQNKYFKSVQFSGLALTGKGSVSFKSVISVSSQISTYSP